MRFFCLLCLLILGVGLNGQEKEDLRIPGEVLVQLSAETEVEQWLKELRQKRASTIPLSFGRTLSKRANIHLFRFDESEYSWHEMQAALQRNPDITLSQPNAKLTFRNTPNDSDFFRQWDMEIIEAPRAWDATTGGTTSKGTPIVVAVMDSGFDPDHEDVQENLWMNPFEIPGDGVDNDNNGYIDDMMGWDFFSDSPNIAPGNHGLSTSAIVGARGNNGIGVTGVNWDVELMLFSFNSVSDLVEAYEYVIEQRTRFNNSNGAAGAFVVATNNSFGQTGVRCEQQPIWGAMYDQLGAVGILSSSGVSNQRFDVDLIGDMPADCTSDYLIISCNTDEDDNLYDDSAFGPTSVDIGAPGEGSITAKPGNTYGTFGGNSAATPHVTGAIALLYASTCEGLEDAAREDPAGTALLVKEILLESGDWVAALENRTLTERRLNLGNAMDQLEASCQNILGPLGIMLTYPNPTDDNLTVEYSSPENGTYQAEFYDALGRFVLHKEVFVGAVGLRRFNMDVSTLPAGTYLLRFGQGDSWVTQKVIVY